MNQDARDAVGDPVTNFNTIINCMEFGQSVVLVPGAVVAVIVWQLNLQLPMQCAYHH